MQLTLLKKNSIKTCILPEKHNGQYWVTQETKNGEERLISVDGIENKWILKSNKNASIVGNKGEKIKEVIIEELCFYPIHIKDSNDRVLLYSEPITKDRRCFEKLLINSEGKLTIGRAEDCDISFNNSFTSSKHAEISIHNNEVYLKDLDSSNGTFVNGVRVKSKTLLPGDVIYIMGLKIILGKGFIAINNPDGKVSYNKFVLKKFVNQAIDEVDDTIEVTDEDNFKNLFYRSPRFKRDIETFNIKIDPPPQLGNLEEVPLALLLGPSITMGLTSFLTGALTIQNVLQTKGEIRTVLPTLAMSFSMLLGTILWPILTKRYEKNRRIKREKLRQVKYTEYLEKIRQEILYECGRQSKILNENHVDIGECISRIKLRERNLWERTKSQKDFLQVRLGLGNLPLDAAISYPERKFTLDDDKLMNELYNLADEPKILKNVPVTLSLIENFIIGIIGNRNKISKLVTNLIFQISALHSYDELKFVFIYNPKEKHIWDFVKWLPYVWGKDNSIRFVATNNNEVKELSAFIEKELNFRSSITSEEALKDMTPHYVVFLMDRELASKNETIQSILKQKRNLGFSLIALYDELKHLPKECSMVVEVTDGKSKIYDKNDITGKNVLFELDNSIAYDSNELAICLANTRLDTSVNAYNLPNMLTFLDMFGVGKIEHLNALSRWKENDPTLTLETPIGVDSNGELFKLDAHEKFHGPHGLIAGTTGSGKSEFIMTYILSLALNYHPYEVAFILIDYKGGGMANTFEKLPHLVGTITNLDGAAVKRSLVSIQSELKRRQAIFSETSRRVNVSNIDIYSYQKLYRDGLVSEPLQHLFIISDEFAELKAQQPEFMAQLISASRIGRSLGVHLIPATQKPSGVVDDQIWSNTKFRICLKVQDKADSMDILKRPDASELTVTGRFYVQVGTGELFELGQSAWGGAPYYPADRLEKKIDNSITVIDSIGRVVKQARVDNRKKVVSNPPKQIDEIVSYISELATEENIKVKPLWLEPISGLIFLEDIILKHKLLEEGKGVLNPIIGEVDDPVNQNQFAMTLPISNGGNTIIFGAAESGKTTFLTTLIYSLSRNHSPDEVNMYVLDFASETLRSFSKLPHVGDVILSNEEEKVTNLLRYLAREIERRKKLFADYGGDYKSYINSGFSIESIVVMIHNYSAFSENYSEKEDLISYLSREGIKYGIYFILTALNSNSVRFRISQNFKQLYTLQMNDNSDYAAILGNTGGMYPSQYKGRGIYKSDMFYEFQIAHITKSVENTFEFVRSYCLDYAHNWEGKIAKRIPILPKRLDVEYLSSIGSIRSFDSIPVGIEKVSLNLSEYDFNNSFISSILSQNDDNQNFIQGIAETLSTKDDADIFVIDTDGIFKEDDTRQYSYITAEDDLDEFILNLFKTLVQRNNTYKDAKEAGEELPIYKKQIYIISSFTSFLSSITEESKNKFKRLIEKGDSSITSVNFIISDKASSIANLTYEDWLGKHVSLADFIWVGNGIAEVYQLKLAKITTEMRHEIEENFGYVVNKGKAKLVKLISSITNSREVNLDE